MLICCGPPRLEVYRRLVTVPGIVTNLLALEASILTLAAIERLLINVGRTTERTTTGTPRTTSTPR